MRKKIKKIGILCFWTFPEGMAATTRMLAYSTGIAKQGVVVEIFSFARIFKSDVYLKKIAKSGSIGGVFYKYSHFFSNLSRKNKLIRWSEELFTIIITLINIIISNSKNKIDYLFVNFDDIYSFRKYLMLLKIFRFKLIFVADEFPIPIRDFMKENVPEKLMKKYRYFHKYFNGRILMTEALEEFYNINTMSKPTHILSTIVDVERFINLSTILNVEDCKYLCYMGNLCLKKDNVENIILAFGMISKKYPTLKLRLYGEPSKHDRDIIKNLIHNHKLVDKVLLMGRISNSLVPSILSKAFILVTSQPNTVRAKGGFPTKLGEYLACGIPTIATDVGEITHYVKDDVQCYIVEACNPEAYAKKIEYIINNYDKAKEVALVGKKYILSNFSKDIVASNLIQFLENLKE